MLQTIKTKDYEKPLTVILLSILTVKAYANNKVKAERQKQPQAKAVKDTAMQSAKENPYGERMYDPRLGRYMPVTPSQRQQSRPYQYKDTKAVRL